MERRQVRRSKVSGKNLGKRKSRSEGSFLELQTRRTNTGGPRPALGTVEEEKNTKVTGNCVRGIRLISLPGGRYSWALGRGQTFNVVPGS